MAPIAIYKINFLNKDDKVIGTMQFTSESQRDALYDNINSVDHYLVPDGATQIEKEKVESYTLTPSRQPRRSLISGRYKGGGN